MDIALRKLKLKVKKNWLIIGNVLKVEKNLAEETLDVSLDNNFFFANDREVVENRGDPSISRGRAKSLESVTALNQRIKQLTIYW